MATGTGRPDLAINSQRGSLVKHILRILLIGAPAVFVLAALYILSAEFLLRSQTDTLYRQATAAFARHEDAFLSDLKFINSSPLTKEFRSLMLKEGKDAGPFLNAQVFWSSSPEFLLMPREQKFGKEKPLVPAKSQELLLRYQDQWLKGKSFLESGRLRGDTDFFSHLTDYDYWDIDSNSPLVELKKNKKFVPYNFIPLPDTLDLISVTKIHLLQGAIHRTPLKTLIETRKLASLLLTTEYMPLVISGLAILDLERQAYRDYVDRSYLAEHDWHPISANITRRARRSWLATSSYLSVIYTSSQIKEVFQKTPTPLSLCAAMNYRLPNELALRNRLTGSWPLEHNYRSQFERLDSLIVTAKSHCRLKLFQALYEPTLIYHSSFEEAVSLVSTLSLSRSAPIGAYSASLLGRLPYLRATFSLREILTWPIYLESYSK